MRVIAPGKLVLTGAYAVLYGAPAIVVAVDRYAIADVDSPERVDVRALQDSEGRKLGLGSSAASLVASRGARAVARGEDPRQAPVRARLFRAAKVAHAREQGGGSGVDVAASVHGGALRYVIAGSAATMRAIDLPHDLVISTFWSGTSARTSDLLARVRALRARAPSAEVFAQLRELATRAAESAEGGDSRGLIEAAAVFGGALDALGVAAEAPIVPASFAELAALARSEHAAFLPSGAGGGDVAVWLGTASPSAAFIRRAETLAVRPLQIAIDRGGVRPESLS